MIVLVLIVFLLSGVAALLYQVIWQRMLVMFSGVDVYSSTIIVAAFMAGLGIGNLVGGYVADRSSRRRNLLLFAGAELAIAAFSVISRPLYYDLLYQRLGPYALPAPVMAALLFGSLLWPTFFMGLSLPLLARAMTERIERAASIVGALYGVNTLGAAIGAFGATWWILPRLGLAGSLRVGALLNVACALVVLPLVPRLADVASTPVSTATNLGTGPAPTGAEPSGPFVLWAAIAALSGWLALSLEIVWFRLLGVLVKSTAFTFGTLLGTYLLGLGVGSLVGSVVAPKIRRPAIVFLALQSAVGLSAAALVAIFVGSIDSVPRLQAYFGGYEPHTVRESVVEVRALLASLLSASPLTRIPAQFLALYVVIPAFLIVLPTFMMGFSFPVLQRVVQTDLARVGRRVGQVLLANIAGSVAGTVLTGWVLLDTLGTAGTLKLLAGFSSLFVLLGIVLLARTRRRTANRAQTPAFGLRVAVGMALIGVLVAAPNAASLWGRLHGVRPDRMIFAEDASGLSVFRIDSLTFPSATVFVNGVGQSIIPYGDVHTVLGMLPAFVHPDPRTAAIIGLGSGDTLYGLAGRQEIERIVSIEIIRPQLDTLRRYSLRQPYPGALGLLADPRVEHVAGDGRAYLMHSGREFDIIEADALRPTSAYSGNLFSEEYFTLVRSRLRPRGLAATWSPTIRVHNSFVRVFPYVISVPGMLLGSTEPIEIDREALAARIGSARVREHYAAAGIDLEQLMRDYLANPTRFTPDFDRTALTDFNTDLFPKDEFDLSTPR